MTATNHALTGAVLALAIKRPELALPCAFLSHFLLDALPHFGIANVDVFERNRKPIAIIVIGLDITLFITVMVWLFAASWPIAGWIVGVAALVAVSPDFGWVYRFAKENKTHTWTSGNFFSRFHERIQWGEFEWGAIVEAVWAAGMIWMIGVIA